MSTNTTDIQMCTYIAKYASTYSYKYIHMNTSLLVALKGVGRILVYTSVWSLCSCQPSQQYTIQYLGITINVDILNNNYVLYPYIPIHTCTY